MNDMIYSCAYFV